MDVIVIGGGASGCGIAWDLALRGLSVTLVEQGRLASGTSGRFHGLVHSGARYAVSDPAAAEQCARESAVLMRVVPKVVRPTGGLFALTERDDAAYASVWDEGCRTAGIPAREVVASEALQREPLLSGAVRKVFEVPDAVCAGPTLCQSLAAAAKALGAEVRVTLRAEEIMVEGGRARGVRVTDLRTGEGALLEGRLVIVAAGAWSARLLESAGLALSMSLLRGAMIAIEGPRLTAVVSRLQSPADGDIALPRGGFSIIGTTSIPTEDPEDRRVEEWEAALIRERIFDVLPGLRGGSVRHVWSAVRPLFRPGGAGEGRPDNVHEWSRDFTVIDHAHRDRVEGLLTVVGGKLTTFRLMAEKTADAATRALGLRVSCRTAETPLP